MNKHKVLLICLTLLLSACYRIPDKIEPNLHYAVQDHYLKYLSPPFLPITPTEKETAWGQEYLIGQRFAKDLDLYRAITTFKRSEYLIPQGETKRLFEIQYQIILCYYLGKRYADAITSYNHSRLYTISPSFPAYHDLLIILYESYLQTDDRVKADHILRALKNHFPETAKKLDLATILIKGKLAPIEKEASNNPSQTYISEILTTYEAKKKSISKAQTLNMILPGSGYLYVGQKQSALTAFLLNGLFIAATAHFFHKGQIAAGIITASFETGWYFGGIYGAGESAKLYNERLYESLAYPALSRNHLFPVLMLKYGF